MAMAAKERKIKALFDASMAAGGVDSFKTNFEQSLGVHTDEHMTFEGVSREVQTFDPDRREVDYKELHVGGCMAALLGPEWRQKFEQSWVKASRMKFEGIGSSVMAGDLPYVSAALDVIAGLANARALDRSKDPTAWIWDQFCTPVEIMGEGGFDIGARPNFDVAKPQDGTDLAPGQRGPTVPLIGTRVHRNRTTRQMKRVQLNKWLVVHDLTGQIYEAVDDVADLVLWERERKVADCAMGIGSATVPSVSMSQDGLTFFPFQAGIYGTNAGAALPSPQNQKLIQNFANAVTNDGHGFDTYQFLVRALQVLTSNCDPFTGLPCAFPMEGMKVFCVPAAKPQLEVLLSQLALWQIQNANGTTTGLSGAGTATVSSFELLKKLRIEVVTSQVWANRLAQVGIQKATPAAGGSAAYQALTNAVGDTFSTANSVMSFGLMGHFQEAIKYHILEPFTSSNIPLGPDQYAEQTVMIQDFNECGSAYWVQPRKVWRQYA